MVRNFFVGAFCAFAIIFLLLGLMNLALSAPPVVLTQEATIGQQDRSLHVEVEPYDNSDFLRDMDAIARGTFVEPLEPATDPLEPASGPPEPDDGY